MIHTHAHVHMHMQAHTNITHTHTHTYTRTHTHKCAACAPHAPCCVSLSTRNASSSVWSSPMYSVTTSCARIGQRGAHARHARGRTLLAPTENNIL